MANEKRINRVTVGFGDSVLADIAMQANAEARDVSDMVKVFVLRAMYGIKGVSEIQSERNRCDSLSTHVRD